MTSRERVLAPKAVISSEPCNGDREIPMMIKLGIPSLEDAPSLCDEDHL
jgi:hypothetical protein